MTLAPDEEWHIISQLLAQTTLQQDTPLQRWRHSLIWHPITENSVRRRLNLYLAPRMVRIFAKRTHVIQAVDATFSARRGGIF